jgi:hypothetical protein
VTERRSVGQRILSVPQFIAQWAAATREGHRFAQESLEHADKMLTWAIGLMGAGIFSSKEFLAAAPLTLRFAALLPWVAGIICAVAGRLFGADVMPRNNLHHYDRVNRMEWLPLILEDEQEIRSGIDDVLNNEGGLKKKAAAVRRRLHAANFCFYAAHILLAVGIIAVVVVAYCTGK